MMVLLDTDILSLLTRGHPLVTARAEDATDAIGITIITRIEILRARFDFLLKAADGDQLQRAQHWLSRTDSDLAKLPIAMVDADAATAFDRLRRQPGLRRIGRADLLIASIALARQATLVTRNVKHFRQIPNLKLENWAN